jgi:hypothetical protein
LIEKETIEKEELVEVLEGLEKRPQRTDGVRGSGVAVARRAVTAPPKDDGGPVPR